ncbi:MAG: DUF3068 domain-containing protein [Chloroflexi bacterium]|nr:DUF3068 domain-containing protein [Chloroflexota bacterium]
MTLKGFIPAVILVLAAVLLRFWIVPLQTRLPADFSNELTYQAEDRFRESPDGEWFTSSLTARGTQQALAVSGNIVLIQSELHWYSETDEIILESSGLYGVDRDTRLNITAYGDTPRQGQFLFPAHAEKKKRTHWDSQYIGPRSADYERTETRDGLQVYVFRFHAEGLDETDGYNALPGVPERLHAYTDGEGTFWVEPVSGVVVDYEEQGLSYFTDPISGKRLSDFHGWSAHYAPETRAVQQELARAARLRILALETYLPFTLLFAAFVVLIRSLREATLSGCEGERRSNLPLYNEIASTEERRTQVQV